MSSLLNYFSDTPVVVWLMLFPLTYVLHIADEYWSGDGYSTHLLNYYGIELSPRRFIALQILGLLLMSVGAGLAVTFRFPNTMLVILTGVVLVNCCVHLVRSVLTRNNEPGLKTALLLWLPLGCMTLLRVWHNMSTARLCSSLIVGGAISGIVEVITQRGGKLFVVR